MKTHHREGSRLIEDAADRLAFRRVGLVLAGGRPDTVHMAFRGVAGAASVPHAHTLFEIGSVTKTFTALLLADGVERGLWRLDTLVAELLPGKTVVPSRDGVQITLQHLATHTSGLPRSPSGLGVRENIAYLRTGADPYGALTEKDVLEGLGRAHLSCIPGTGKPHYSNLGFGILGIAMATSTGVGFGSLVRSRICEPLGLRDTVVDGQMTPEQRHRMATGHRSRRRTAEPWPLPGIAGAGALRSTAVDMRVFLAAQVDPGGTPLERAILLTHTTPPGGPAEMGLGWHPGGDDLLWHNGGTGGFRSIAIVSQQAGVVTFASINQSRGADLHAFRLIRRLGG